MDAHSDAHRSQGGADSLGIANLRTDPIELLRRWILGVLVLGLLGTVTELVLLEHYEQPMQFVPLVLIAAAVVVLAWEVRRRNTASRRALQILMALFVLAGFVGFVAHFHGSAEFQLDLNPDMSIWELLEKVLRAKAPPLLAPGMMLQLGLLGLAYVFSDSRYRRSETT
jgi:uncharacterized membrane protein